MCSAGPSGCGQGTRCSQEVEAVLCKCWQPEPLQLLGSGELAELMPAPRSWFLVAGILPRSWSHYTVPAGMTVIQWVSDFSERIKQLQNISQAAASGGAKELKVGKHGPEKSG